MEEQPPVVTPQSAVLHRLQVNMLGAPGSSDQPDPHEPQQ